LLQRGVKKRRRVVGFNLGLWNAKQVRKRPKIGGKKNPGGEGFQNAIEHYATNSRRDKFCRKKEKVKALECRLANRKLRNHQGLQRGGRGVKNIVQK